MTHRPCLVCRRTFLVTKVCKSRCEGCQQTYDQARYAARDAVRPSPRERGYDAAHRRERARWVARIEAGETVNCWRCGRRITRGMRWMLGHHDGTTQYAGPECVSCNSATVEPGRITAEMWRHAQPRRSRPQ